MIAEARVHCCRALIAAVLGLFFLVKERMTCLISAILILEAQCHPSVPLPIVIVVVVVAGAVTVAVAVVVAAAVTVTVTVTDALQDILICSYF